MPLAREWLIAAAEAGEGVLLLRVCLPDAEERPGALAGAAERARRAFKYWLCEADLLYASYGPEIELAFGVALAPDAPEPFEAALREYGYGPRPQWLPNPPESARGSLLCRPVPLARHADSGMRALDDALRETVPLPFEPLEAAKTAAAFVRAAGETVGFAGDYSLASLEALDALLAGGEEEPPLPSPWVATAAGCTLGETLRRLRPGAAWAPGPDERGRLVLASLTGHETRKALVDPLQRVRQLCVEGAGWSLAAFARRTAGLS